MASSRHNTFLVEVVSHRSDCLVSLPREYTEANLTHMGTTNAALHRMFYPVELLGERKKSSSSAPALVSMGFAAASLLRPSTKDGRLQVGPQFAKDLGLADGDAITTIPATYQRQWRVAKRVEILPLNADESEVIEKNAYQLQSSLMQSLRVLFPGQKVTLRTSQGVQATVVVSRQYADPPDAACYVLADGTELLVAVKNREEDKPKALSDAEKKRLPISGIVRLVPRTMMVEAAFFCSGSNTNGGDDAIAEEYVGKALVEAGGADEDGKPSAAFVHPSAIKAFNWCSSATSASTTVIGAINIADLAWADLKGDAKDAPAGGDANGAEEARRRPPIMTTSFIRAHGTMLAVQPLPAPQGYDEQRSAAFFAALPHNAMYVPSLAGKSGVFTATNVFAQINPEAQFGVNGAEALLSKGSGSSVSNSKTNNYNNGADRTVTIAAAHPCVRTVSLAALEEVHGEALSSGLAQQWGPMGQYNNGADARSLLISRDAALSGSEEVSCAPSPINDQWDLCNNNTLLVGPKGCGKSTIASVCALHSGRHVVTIDCAAPVTALMEGAIAELNLCSPSLLLLDNFDVLASSANEGGGGGPPTAITPATELMIQQWLLHNRRAPGADIMVVAMVPSFEELQPTLKLPLCFPRVVKIPPALSHDKKAALMRQLFAGAVAGPSSSSSSSPTLGDHKAFHAQVVSIMVDVVGKMVENFTAGDLSGLCAKIGRWYTLKVKPSLAPGTTTKAELLELLSAATIGPIAATFVPRSQVGIRFLGADKKSTTRAPSWDDAGGLVEAKAALHDVLVLPLKFPKLFAKLPLKTKSGVLLHGPSGCGKTYLLSVAVAAEGLHCIVVNGPEIFGKYIGTSEQKIREIFESAQAAAPCVIFFDEFDSVAPRRGNSNTGVTDRVVNQLLCYLDGVEGRKDVYVVAATSRPDLIDPALLRPGRLDRQVACPMPDHSDRKSIMAAHLRKTIPVAAEDQSLGVTDADLDALADATEGYTSADIAGLISSANSQVIQSFFKLSGDTLLAQLADGGGVGAAAAEDSASNDPFTVLVGAASAGDKGVAAKKIKESLLRNESIAAMAKAAAGGGASSSALSADDKSSAAASNFPKVAKDDILSAMEKFSRSRESQKQQQAVAEPDEELVKKLKELKKMMGTRQTSA